MLVLPFSPNALPFFRSSIAACSASTQTNFICHQDKPKSRQPGGQKRYLNKIVDWIIPRGKDP